MKSTLMRGAKLMAATLLLAGVLAPTAMAFDPSEENRAEIDDPGKLVTTKKRLKIDLTFRSNFPDSTFKCSLEKGRPSLDGSPKRTLKPCSSPATYAVELPPLRHKRKRSISLYFWVRATSPSEESSPSPDPQYRAFTITRKAKPKV